MDITNDTFTLNNVRKPDIERVEQERQEYHFIGEFIRTRGLRLFGYNPHTDKIFEVETIKHDTAILSLVDGKFTPTAAEPDKCTVDPRYEYFEALNEKTARKRIERYKNKVLKDLCNLRKLSKEGIKLY